MRILVTGSSGLIGTSLALRCMESGIEVLGVDCRENTWSSEIDTFIHDLRQALPLDLSVGGKCPDVVVHLAAHAKVHELVQNPLRALENTTMTSKVLEYCRAKNLACVFSSSREVYGNTERKTFRESDADFRDVASPYTASKIASETLLHSYARCYGLPFIIFRLSNVYGRYDHDIERMERVIPLFLDLIQNEKTVTVFGAEKVLDFTYIDDCVDGILCGIQRLHQRQVVNETINLAYGQGHTLSALAGYLGECFDKSPKINIQPSQIGEVTYYVANIDKARELLGYCPKVNLREGIKRTVISRRAGEEKEIEALAV
jgi:nucleoside-diphosphate-sugar epimerase